MSRKRILILVKSDTVHERTRIAMAQEGGYEVAVYSLAPTFPENLFQIFAPPSFTRRCWRGWLGILHLRWVIQRFRPDLIHVHWGLWNYRVLGLMGFHPLVVSVMGGDLLQDEALKGTAHGVWRRHLFEMADAITTKSTYMDSAVLRVGDYRSKLRRVTWGIDTNRFRPGLDVFSLRQRLLIEPQHTVFFCVRGCVPKNNKLLVMRAFAAIVQRGADAVLLVTEYGAPDPDCYHQLHQLAEIRGVLSHVRFLGSIPETEMPHYYNLAHCTIQVPDYDGMPQSLYEAMACGSYPLLSKLPEYEDMVQHGANGHLVTTGNVDALASVMSWVVEHRDQLGAIALYNRDLVQKIAYKSGQTRLLAALYKELI